MQAQMENTYVENSQFYLVFNPNMYGICRNSLI